MRITCYGINHHKTAFHNLGAISFDEHTLAGFLREFRVQSHVLEVFGVSTCNRVEFYFCGDNQEQDLDILKQLLHEHVQSKGRCFPWETCYTLDQYEAVDHFFQVACGVNSLVVGEQQILTQIKIAERLAREAGTFGKRLGKLLTSALRIGRRVREETLISRGNVSVPSIAIQTARRALGGDLSQSRVLIIGAGKLAMIAAQQFTKCGAGQITIVNRTEARALELAKNLGLASASYENLQQCLIQSDIVVTTTGAENYLVTQSMAAEVLSSRPGASLVYLDLSLPRNIDPLVGEVDGIVLYAIEHLEETARQNREQRLEELDKAMQMLQDEVQSFQHWVELEKSRALSGQIRQRVESIRQEKLQAITGLQKQTMDRFSDSLLRSVFHELMQNIRQIDASTPSGLEEIKIIEKMFGLPLEPVDITPGDRQQISLKQTA